MVKYLETFLGNTAKNIWLNFKATHESDYNKLISLGNNPHNFTNLISNLLTAADPSMGSRLIQSNAIRQLEQLSMYSWEKIPLFLQDYLHLCVVSQNIFNPEFIEKLFRKLLGPLGQELHEACTKWRQEMGENYTVNLSSAIYLIMTLLEQKCQQMMTQKQLKTGDWKLCSNIYTA